MTLPSPRPSPDEIIEAFRPPGPDPEPSSPLEEVSSVVFCLVAAILVLLAFAFWFIAWAETGEVCPDAPKGWLGWCSALEDR